MTSFVTRSGRTARRAGSAVAAAAALTLAGTGAVAAAPGGNDNGGGQRPPDRTTSAGEPVDLDALFVGAHPDDEAFQLSAYGEWGAENDLRTGVVTVTRGEGGGNAVGPEEGPPLGLLRDESRPLQFLFAGKAHPADRAGQEMIRTLFQLTGAALRGRLVFVEDYDMLMGRMLVQGCDVWLNTPRKPHEASGTSGMKASMNGTLHLSILDGWWAEGYTGTHGWAIDPGTTSSDHAEIDAADAEALFSTLENEVVPAFYERDAQGLPRRWIEMVKRSILEVVPRFSARRMLKDYVRLAYRRGFEPRSK